MLGHDVGFTDSNGGDGGELMWCGTDSFPDGLARFFALEVPQRAIHSVTSTPRGEEVLQFFSSKAALERWGNALNLFDDAVLGFS
jgi:hypothetical protein